MFAKNGVATYFNHWNVYSTNISWNCGGLSAVFVCAANDTLALFIQRPPAPTGPNAIAQNLGKYPNTHGAIWCKLVG